MESVELAISVVSSQTAAIRKELRKNRNRTVYQVEPYDDEVFFYKTARTWRQVLRICRTLPCGAVIRHGMQNARWIKAGNLRGIRWNDKLWYFSRSK